MLLCPLFLSLSEEVDNSRLSRPGSISPFPSKSSDPTTAAANLSETNTETFLSYQPLFFRPTLTYSFSSRSFQVSGRRSTAGTEMK